MPILDLLASITGEKPATSSPNPPPRPSVVVPKRKAEDELRSGGAKTARTDSPADKTLQPSSNSSRPSPRPAERTLGLSTDKPSKPQVSLSKPASNDRLKPTSLAVSSTAKAPATGTKPLPSRPAVNRPSPTDSGPPKKRSYAEIMARAKANSEQRESLGKIHHKTVERSLTMKERKDLKAEEARKSRVAARKGTSGRPGATTAPARDIPKASGPRERVPPPSGSALSRKSAPVEEKKVKKAALATTGYTGTARPRPGASTLAKPATSRPSSDARAGDRSRYGGSGSRNRYEEEDEDLDDFIEYDDEEEPPAGYGNGRGGGYNRYDSYDEESDMEAGLSDIEDEEQLADRQARREDLEQDALERKLKLEKEERKKRLMQGSKARAGGR